MRINWITEEELTEAKAFSQEECEKAKNWLDDMVNDITKRLIERDGCIFEKAFIAELMDRKEL